MRVWYTACMNLMGDSYCQPRAAQGLCEANPDWMVLRCRRACRACNNLGLCHRSHLLTYLLTDPVTR